MTQELNCSDAAKMLIERMATHPEDFTPGERFWRVTQIINGESDMGFEPVISKRDLDALTTAAQQLFESTLMEYVLHKLLVKDEEARLGRASRQKGKSNTILSSAQMAQQGSSLMNSVYANVVNQQLQNAMQTGTGIAVIQNPYQNIPPNGSSK